MKTPNPLPLRNRRWLMLAVALTMLAPARAASVDVTQMERGRQIYADSCAICHLEDGTGMPLLGTPPLAGSDFLQADRARAIRISLNGITDEIMVNGKSYTGMMPGQHYFRGPRPTSSGDIADALTFVMNSWGNGFGAVTPEEVAAVLAGDRAALAYPPAVLVPESKAAPVAVTPAQRDLYIAKCSNCHGAQGRGLGDHTPAPAGSGPLGRDRERVIRIVLAGKGGTGSVADGPQQMDMPLQVLSDQQMVDILNYVFNSWGNRFGTVTADDVAKVRSKL